MRRAGLTVLVAALACVAGLQAQAPPQKPGLTPKASSPSDLRVRVERIGVMPTHANPTSPAVAGSHLLLIDQGGYLYRWDGTTATLLLSQKTLPKEVRPLGNEWLLNVAADRAGTRVYVVVVSASAPKGVPRRESPRDPDGWYLLFEYQFDGTTLSAPRPVVALGIRSEGHTGGGLVVADDGAVLLAVGDNGDSFEDGREHGQMPQTHLAKIVRIAPADGTVSVVGMGIRGVQRLALSGEGAARWLTFADPGGWVAEEVNAVPLATLDAASPPNFGWGRHPGVDASREGSFLIDRMGNSRATAPIDEPGFVQPVAEFGRVVHEPIAVSGPVSSPRSFARITLLFGDLVGGRLLATTGPLGTRHQEVFEVGVVDQAGTPTTLKALGGGERADVRFFTFPDGTAGVLFERTGEFHRVTEMR